MASSFKFELLGARTKDTKGCDIVLQVRCDDDDDDELAQFHFGTPQMYDVAYFLSGSIRTAYHSVCAGSLTFC